MHLFADKKFPISEPRISIQRTARLINDVNYMLLAVDESSFTIATMAKRVAEHFGWSIGDVIMTPLNEEGLDEDPQDPPSPDPLNIN